MIYTGIGARKTPNDVLESMITIGKYMAMNGHTLRSGGARGADSAFEEGCDNANGLKEIFNPEQACQAAMDLAKDYHPAWHKLSPFVKRLMGRNSYQLLGKDLKTRTTCIFCWTPGGRITGGTGQALRMAGAFAIPVFNYGKYATIELAELAISNFLQPRN